MFIKPLHKVSFFCIFSPTTKFIKYELGAKKVKFCKFMFALYFELVNQNQCFYNISVKE